MGIRPWIRSAASPRSGSFQRDWIAAELTEENATKKGLIYRSPEGQIVYTVIDRAVIEDLNPLKDDLTDAEAYWIVQRHSVIDRRVVRSSRDEFPALADAISAASAEHGASIRRFGPVPEDEWPEDREIPWIMPFSYFASPKRRG